MSPDNLVRLVLTIVVLYLWTDNVLRAYHNWNEYRDSRSFRAFLIGFMIELGAVAFLIGAIAAILPDLTIASRFFGLMVVGALLVVGVFTWVSWRRTIPR